VESKRSLMLRLPPEVYSLIILIGLLTIFTIFSNYRFLSYENLRALGRLLPDLGVVALGVAMLMIAGEFDLSISSQIPLCSYVMITLLKSGFGEILSLLVVLGVGAVLGFINAVITIRGRIPSFITTLGTMLLWRGVVYVWSGMMPIPLRPYLPETSILASVFVSEVFGVPVQIIWFVAVAIVLGLILHRHRFGNWVYATGDNELAAKEMGINTALTKTICFMTVGILAALVSVLQLYRIESFAATQGIGFEFRAIAACVIGGISLKGGSGSIIGAILGIIAMQTIDTGLILMGVPVFGVSAFIGIVIVVFGLLVTRAGRKFVS
jgi:simple sugar transport system permease protein